MGFSVRMTTLQGGRLSVGMFYSPFPYHMRVYINIVSLYELSGPV